MNALTRKSTTFIVFIALSLLMSKAWAQCTTVTDGQNLIVNGDFSSGAASFSSGYTQHCLCPSPGCSGRDQSVSGYSNAGEYCVTNDIYQNFHCCLPNNNGTITHVFTDNSPTADNMAMLVDGNSTLGVDIWCQTVNVQAFTNYYFTTAIATLFDDNNPATLGQIKFRINGVVVGSSIISPGSIGSWTTFTQVWSSGAVSGPISICITNDNTNATGNDFALDDIYFTPGCAFGAPGPLPNLGPDISLCGNNPATLNSGVTSTSTMQFIWKNSAGTIISSGSGAAFATLSGITTGDTYSVCVRETSPTTSCYRSDAITVTNTFSINLGPDKVLCSPASATLDPAFTGSGVTYSWKKDGVLIPGATSATYLATAAGTYDVFVTAPGCGTQTDQIIITTNTATPVDGYFCTSPSIVPLSVTGPNPAANYDWYDAASAGTLLATGTKNWSTPPISASTTYYVQDNTSVTIHVGYTAPGAPLGSQSAKGPTQTPEEEMRFTTYVPLTIQSFKVSYNSFNCFGPPTSTYTFYLKDAGTNAILQTYVGTVPCGTSGTFQLSTIPVNFIISTPGNYYISPGGMSAGWQADWYGSGATYGSGPTMVAGVLKMTGFPTGFFAPNAYPNLFDWVVSYGSPCARTPVRAIKLAAGDPACPLPVELLTFNAAMESGEAVLVWSTGSEKSSHYFSIERSADAENFVQIGTMSAAGSSSQLINYSYTDLSVPSGIIYYRLAAYDIEGKVSYSVIRSVTSNNAELIQISPNPNQGIFTLRAGLGGEIHLKIFNALGQEVYASEEKTATSLFRKELSLTNLSAGIYYLQVQTSKQTWVRKIVKE
ncbi:MAG: T9SS type A sorting domain-containing protein [Cytophagaceae bacterium]